MTNSGNAALRALTRGRLVAALALAVGMQGLMVAPSAHGADATAWATTRTHVPDTATAAFNGYAADQEPVSIAVSLNLRNKDVLESYTKALFRPAHPSTSS